MPLALAFAACGCPAVQAQVPSAVLGAELPRGELQVTGTTLDPVGGARERRADGDLSDWVASPTGFAGTARYAHGEYVYEDHLWDAYGAMGDDGAWRTAAFDAGTRADASLYRVEAAALYLPTGTNFGAGPMDEAADILEVRVAAPQRHAVALLVRTTTMTAEEQPAVVVLADTRPGDVSHAVPFGSGLTTRRGDVALLLAGGRGVAVDLATGVRREVPVAVRPDGYDNALEASVPRELVTGQGGRLHLAVAAGRLDRATRELAPRATGPAVANVAFRDEPVRPTFERRQASVLHDGTIDPFFADIDPAMLADGTTQAVRPGPGYHDRVVESDPALSQEGGTDGVFQHYGAYLPPRYRDGTPSATTFFLHGSGNDAHDLPAVLPGLMRALGDERGSVVLAPKGRTALSLWEGAGLADVLEVWQDAASAFSLDRSRTAMAGYSMGGLGAFLLPALMPDRFAATFAIAGPVGGDVRSPGVGLRDLPDVRRVFANLRWVPTLVYSGGADNNVPLSNGLAAADALAARGYRHRLDAFPADNHFTPGAVDRWAPAVDYLRAFDRIDADPPRITYTRDMAVEREVEQARLSDQQIFPAGGHQFDFDHAYWMSELTPVDTTVGVASVDARSLAIRQEAVRPVEESGAGASPDPFVWRGLRWQADGPPKPTSNQFTATLQGASAVRLDTHRMHLDPERPIRAQVSTDHELELRLSGPWRMTSPVTVDGRRSIATLSQDGLVLRVPPGDHAIVVAARGE